MTESSTGPASKVPSLASSSKRNQSELQNGNVATEKDLVKDILDRCAAMDVDVLTDLCNNFERFTVILPYPTYFSLFFNEQKWKSSCIKTLYLFSTNDDELQDGIRQAITACKGKLRFRLFARLLPVSLDDFLHPAQTYQPSKTNSLLSDLNGWTYVIHPDDRSPPFRRVMILPFVLGKMSPQDREEFLDQLRHEIADLIMFEHVNEETLTTAPLTVSDWAALMRRHSGAPSEKSVVTCSNGKAFGMVVRFYHQDEQSERVFMRKGSSDGDLPALSASRRV